MARASLHEDLQPYTDATGNCVSQNLTAGAQIRVQLDVDPLSNGTCFLDYLSQSIVSFDQYW
jgi:hypothetical protein